MATTIEPLKPTLGEEPRVRLSERATGGERPDSSRQRFACGEEHSPPPASTGIWVVLASITMSFLAFTSALIVRKGGATDWRRLRCRPFSTSIPYCSSPVALRSKLAAAKFGELMTAKALVPNPARWLYMSLGLGLLFVVGQFVAWSQLRAQGLFLATNPNSSFFYVLTVTHALHVFGGLGGLTRVIVKLNRSTLRKSTLDATSHYWHFMGGLWVYLLWLLWAKL